MNELIKNRFDKVLPFKAMYSLLFSDLVLTMYELQLKK